mmetsp:Transcript_2481/g.5215  ORF Transcript_2481/g.5215 Transcript_2481/m.5215 type:complete len:214 (+) Transcript_2481:991-1632(+)
MKLTESRLLAIQATPFMRSSGRSGPLVCLRDMASASRCGSNGRSALNVACEMAYSSLSATCAPVRASSSQPECFSASSSVNRGLPRSARGSSSPCVVTMISAVGLRPCRACRSFFLVLSLTRSTLLSSSTFANSICESSSSAIDLASPSVACQPRSLSISSDLSSISSELASTTVTRFSSFATSESERPSSPTKVKVSATGIGSDMPLDSTMT